MARSWSHAQFRKDFSDEGRRSMTYTVAPGRSHEFIWAASGSKRSLGLGIGRKAANAMTAAFRHHSLPIPVPRSLDSGYIGVVLGYASHGDTFGVHVPMQPAAKSRFFPRAWL
jgi:hypothetical protein